MPNVVLEHSRDFTKTDELMQLCHEHLLECRLFKPETIKVRTLKFEHHLVAGSKDKAFLGVTVRIMPGRTQEQKADLGHTLHEKIGEWLTEAGLSVSHSVLIQETPEGLYFKHDA
jgi:5-carboxymethyl-2-hydroxymuconate isomerase